MANVFTDSMSNYSTNAQLIAKWNGGSSNCSVGGSFAISAASQGMQINNGAASVIIPTYTHYFIGHRIKFVLPTGGAGWTWNFYDHAGGLQLSAQTQTNGSVNLKRGSAVLASSAAGVCMYNTTHMIEFEVKINASTGIFTMYVDTVNVATFSGNTLSTANVDLGIFQITSQANFGNVYINDCYINDDTGTVCNAIMGDVKVGSCTVAGAGGFAQFLQGGTGTGTNWGQLAKALADATSFNFQTTVNDRDSFAMATAPTGTVLGARLWGYAQKDNIGSRSIALTITSSGVDTIGATQSLSGPGYGWYSQDASKDPNTGSLWASTTPLNAAYSGYKIIV